MQYIVNRRKLLLFTISCMQKGDSKMAWTYKSDLHSVVDYSGASKTATKGGKYIKSKNDVYLEMKPLDDRLKKWFKEVQKVLDYEVRSGAFNGKNIILNGKPINVLEAMMYKEGKKVKTVASSKKSDLPVYNYLVTHRNKIKKKIKIATLKKRYDTFDKIAKSFADAKKAGKKI